MEHTLPLIQTKLHRPPLPVDLIPRPRLTELLITKNLPQLILISAPAGYGKSTLAKSWAIASNYPSAWISLDEHDDNLVVFLSYVLAAIRQISPVFGNDTAALLKASTLPPLNIISTTLINELAQISDDYLLVLDDYHLIHNGSIHELLDKILLYPPPSFHLVLCTRLDPLLSLPRLRAQAQVVEFRAEELRFTLEETQLLLQKMIGGAVDQETIISLEERTEGWVTGLRLAALAMRHQVDNPQFQANLAASNRYLSQYLVQEILSQQLAAYSECMVKISILERFNVDLCQVVCFGEPETRELAQIDGNKFLNWLEASSLFLIPLDEQNHWFRFHHLFREFLQDELKRRVPVEGVAELHIRASSWFERHDLFDEALQHALEAQNIERAIQLVSHQRYKLMNQVQWQQIAKDLNLFSLKIVEQSPDLLMLKAWQLYHDGHLAELPAALAAVEQLIEQKLMPSESYNYLLGEVSALRSLLNVLAANPKSAIQYAEQSLELTAPEIWIVRVLARVGLAAALQMVGDLKGAYDTIYDGFNDQAVKTDHAKATLIQTACTIHWIAADLNGMAQAALQCIKLSQKARNPEILGFGLRHLGTASYYQNDLKSAEENFSTVVNKPYQNYGENLAFSFFGLGLTYQSQGYPEKAQRVAEQALNFYIETGNTTFLSFAQAFQTDIALRQGKISKAFVWAEQFSEPLPLVPIYRICEPQLTLVKVWLAQNTPTNRLKAAELLEKLYTLLVSTHNTQFTIEVLALKALLSQANGERQSALSLLEQALKLAEPSGNIRIFIDHGEPLIELLRELRRQGVKPAYLNLLLDAVQPAGGSSQAKREAALVELLTNRELEVLTLLAERKTNDEIAQQLGITSGTVRQHTYNLYQKLEVSNRRKAVTRGIELGLLPK